MTVISLARLQGDLCGFRAHQLYQFFRYDLDNHLSRMSDRSNHILSDGSFLNRVDKLLYYLEAYIRFQKCHLDFLSEQLFTSASVSRPLLRRFLNTFCKFF